VSEDTRRDIPTPRPVDGHEPVRDDETVRSREDEDAPVDASDASREPAATDEYAPVDASDASREPAATDEYARDTTERGHIDRDPSSERVEPTGPSGPGESTPFSAHTGLLPDEDLGTYQQRWDELQVRFIDEPRQSVRQADDLVGEVTHKIAERFTYARNDFEQRWEGDNEPTTEELRQALQGYRNFFQRLVTR
jgi:hypothetical protein